MIAVLSVNMLFFFLWFMQSMWPTLFPLLVLIFLSQIPEIFINYMLTLHLGRIKVSKSLACMFLLFIFINPFAPIDLNILVLCLSFQ